MGRLQEVLQHPATESLALAAGQAALLVAAVVAGPHRNDTHRSIELGGVAESYVDTVMWLTGQNKEVWATVHRDHHSDTDANFLPIIKTADYLEWRDARPEITEPPIPEVFTSLDPAAALTPSQVKSIGATAREPIIDRYSAPESYAEDTAVALLEPTLPRYLYPTNKGWLRKVLGTWYGISEYRVDPESDIDKLAVELRDHHSPALDKDGVPGILLGGVSRYRDPPAAYYKDASKRPEDLRKTGGEAGDPAPKMGIVTLVAGNIALTAALHGGRQPKDIARHVIVGGATAGVAAVGLLFGGNFINSFGHVGASLWRALRSGKPEVKPDGTYSTETLELLKLATLDEVNQDRHHKHPEEYVYADPALTGRKKVRAAPFGSLLDVFVKRGWGLYPGKGFDLKPGERRPDMPSRALEQLVAARVQTIKSAA